MDWEIVWTEPASSDLQAIVAYIAQHNPEILTVWHGSRQEPDLP
jgi:hypothetical protein